MIDGSTLALSALLAGAPMYSATQEVPLARLQAIVDALPRPSVIYLTGRCVGDGLTLRNKLAEGYSPQGLNETSPVRTASVTKTFTAATLLRLWEQDRLDLHAPIRSLISPELVKPLERAGYDLDRITVWHLLNHTSGLYDHASDPRYVQIWFEQPDHQWTRLEQLELSTGWSGPLHAPGTRFVYADTGYVLLGDIIERITDQPLSQAVRDQLGFARLGLQDSWWEVAEAAPPSAQSKAIQTLNGRGTDHLHGSLDTYGGGGLIMSARDMAIFFEALFADRVFEHPRTLSEMTRALPHDGGGLYHLGIMTHTTDGQWRNKGYKHTGFWGTGAYSFPVKGVSIGAVTTDQSGFRALEDAVNEIVKALPCEW